MDPAPLWPDYLRVDQPLKCPGPDSREREQWSTAPLSGFFTHTGGDTAYQVIAKDNEDNCLVVYGDVSRDELELLHAPGINPTERNLRLSLTLGPKWLAVGIASCDGVLQHVGSPVLLSARSRAESILAQFTPLQGYPQLLRVLRAQDAASDDS